MKIMLLKIGALGDVLLGTPLVRQLRKKHPKAQIDYWVGDRSKIVLVGNPNIDALHTFDSSIFFGRNIRGLLALAKRIRGEHYDMVFILDKHWIFGLLALLAGVPQRIGFERSKINRLFLTYIVPYAEARHETYYYLDLLKAVGKPNYKDARLEYHIADEDIAAAKHLLKERKISNYVVAINSGGNNDGEQGGVRRMPSVTFQELLSMLAKKHTVLLLGAPNEREYYDQFVNNRVINFAGQLRLGESIALMKMAKRIYTTECGPLHMAATANEHITCFYGPTAPIRRAPFIKDIQNVWTDEDIYDVDYEIWGGKLKHEYYTKLRISKNMIK